MWKIITILRQEGGRLSWQRTCEKSQLVGLPLMISPSISLKSRIKVTVPTLIEQEFTSCTFGSKKKRRSCEINEQTVDTDSSPSFSPLALSADNVYRKCLANGTWALKGNYSMCKAILHEEVRRQRVVFVCMYRWSSPVLHVSYGRFSLRPIYSKFEFGFSQPAAFKGH